MARERYEPGSEADFERLYRNTYHRILGTLIALLRDRAAAEDCAQETFERAYRNWRTWRPDAPVEAWLHRIAINVAISDRRHQRLRQAGASFEDVVRTRMYLTAADAGSTRRWATTRCS